MMYDSSACMLRMITRGGALELLQRAPRLRCRSSSASPTSRMSRSGSMLARTAAAPRGRRRLRRPPSRPGSVSSRLFKPAPDDGVIVSQQHAQAAPPLRPAAAASIRQRRCPARGAVVHRHRAVQFADALLDAAQAETRRPRPRIEPDAVVGDRQPRARRRVRSQREPARGRARAWRTQLVSASCTTR